MGACDVCERRDGEGDEIESGFAQDDDLGRTYKQIKDDKLRAKKNIPIKCTNNDSQRDPELYNLLVNKFAKQSNDITVSWVTPAEFNYILDSNRNYNRIMNKIKQDKEQFLYEIETLFEDESPVKVCDSTGEVQYYKGTFNNQGQCHGPGIWIRDGSIYFGNFKNDEFSGKGIYMNKDGNYYLGYWENGQCTGKGEIYLNGLKTYEGTFNECKKEGKGHEFYPDGGSFKGEFKKGEKIGEGELTFPDGSSYKGQIENMKFEGDGEYTWASGEKYKGKFNDGKMDGEGEFTWPDGSNFKGNYVNGLKQGTGTFTWENGATFTTEWKNDRPFGVGEFNDPSNNTVEKLKFEKGKLVQAE